MDPTRYAEICRHFEAAAALQDQERDLYLNQLRLNDASLEREVLSLLLSDTAAEQAGFLEDCVPGYSQLTPISRGGQGTVYRATQNRTGQSVALKIVSTRDWKTSDESRFRQAVADFSREIKTVATLRHPNIVRIFDAGECTSGQFFVMELVEGGTLADVQHRLDQHDTARIMQCITEAVAEAHANAVLHLDIKPQNILFDAQLDQPFLVDFGLARLTTADRNSDRIAGTLAYMAPEQFTSGQVDERTDVYGLGATLFYLLTGHAVRQASTIAEAREHQASPDRSTLDKSLSGVNRELARICRRCLDPEPDNRYQSARELARELERFRETEDVQHISQGGTLTLKCSWVFFLINTVVYGLIQIGFPDQSIAAELLTWAIVYTMYVVMFSIFHFAPLSLELERGRLTMEFLWSIWIAKMLAAMVISISMRIGPAESASEAILLSYPMFAALSGMALCSMAPRLWRTLYLFAAGMWVTAIAIMVTLSLGWPIAPLIYGTGCFLGTAIWGIYLRRIASDMAKSEERESDGYFLTDNAVEATVIVDP